MDAGWIVFITVLALGVLVRIIMLRRVRAVSPHIWAELGSPKLLNGTIARQWQEVRYLVSVRYLPLGDPQLTAFSVIYSLLYGAAWLLFIWLTWVQIRGD